MQHFSDWDNVHSPPPVITGLSENLYSFLNPLLSYLLRREKVVNSIWATICFIPCLWVVFSEERTVCLEYNYFPILLLRTRKGVFHQSIIKNGNLYRRLNLRKFDTHWHAERGRRGKCSQVVQETLNKKKEMVQGTDSVWR